MNTNLILIESKRLYSKLEQQRKIFNFDDIEIIQFAIDCCEFSVQTKDWRYLNLALKILDAETIKAKKYKLKKAADYGLNELKKTVL